MSSKGLAVVSGSTPIHKMLSNGLVTFSGSVNVTGSVLPQGDGERFLGSETNRWADIYSVQTTVGAIFEYGLETKGIGDLETGTVVCWHNGRLVPCEKRMDPLVMGVTFVGKNQPIILGAEFILVTGEVKEGDFLVTSDKIGHAMSSKDFVSEPYSLIGKIIGQALENSNSESNLIKCMISKR
jgi:hypothetical protein